MVEVPNEADDYGPIDSIHYKGGPISQKDHTEFRRQNFTDGHKLVIRKKKRTAMTSRSQTMVMNLIHDLVPNEELRPSIQREYVMILKRIRQLMMFAMC